MSDYLHGYSKDEQDRLYNQAKFLEKKTYEYIDFKSSKRLLEVGCGVGAQTKILLQRFPHLQITGIDASALQLKTAARHLKNEIKRKTVELILGDATNLPFKQKIYDSAFVCWLLEHVQSPIDILKEIKRVLKPDGILYCTEVLNSTFFLHPYSPATLQYWFAFNDHQWNIGGDPFIGAKLGNLLLEAKFKKIETRLMPFHYDNRCPKERAEMLKYWTNLLMSGTDSLLKEKRVTQKDITTMKKELSKIKNDPNAVFFYSSMQAKAHG